MNYLNSKLYRLISLINCLDKIAEKIVAERLSYFAKTTNLLYNDQIDSRKQKLAIDAVIILISDIEFNKYKKKTTFVLFINIKDVFSNLNRIQLLEICYKIKLLFACIN